MNWLWISVIIQGATLIMQAFAIMRLAKRLAKQEAREPIVNNYWTNPTKVTTDKNCPKGVTYIFSPGDWEDMGLREPEE